MGIGVSLWRRRLSRLTCAGRLRMVSEVRMSDATVALQAVRK